MSNPYLSKITKSFCLWPCLIPFLSCLHSASSSSTFSNLAFKLIDPVKLLLPVPHDLFFFFKLIQTCLLVFVACLWGAWNVPVHYHVTLSLGPVTSSCHVFRLLSHFLLSLSWFLFYCLSRICCALTTGFPYFFFFLSFTCVAFSPFMYRWLAHFQPRVLSWASDPYF